MNEAARVTVHVSARGLAAASVARACEEARRELGWLARDTVFIDLSVNGVPIGPVPEPVWQIVHLDLARRFGGELSVAETKPRQDTVPPPLDYAQIIEACDDDLPETQRPEASDVHEKQPFVLIAEHVSAVRSRLLASFAAASLDALAVADGHRAIQAMNARPPVAIIADFELPRTAGDELLIRARAQLGKVLRASVLVGAELPRMLIPDCSAADAVYGQPFELEDVVSFVLRRLDAAGAAERRRR